MMGENFRLQFFAREQKFACVEIGISMMSATKFLYCAKTPHDIDLIYRKHSMSECKKKEKKTKQKPEFIATRYVSV